MSGCTEEDRLLFGRLEPPESAQPPLALVAAKQQQKKLSGHSLNASIIQGYDDNGTPFIITILGGFIDQLVSDCSQPSEAVYCSALKQQG